MAPIFRAKASEYWDTEGTVCANLGMGMSKLHHTDADKGKKAKPRAVQRLLRNTMFGGVASMVWVADMREPSMK